ncbi:hypothetical protein TR51_25560 [Kitasatospora griseola]|uniref:Adenylate kinase n=1 Tax=Kitasatospora griseola TaxID=2064 RepID=A0A0D0PIT4_KITGR|nr:hypothetical protein [Kitasatospora griseola]KIQ62409.1 hypothetical protein TR51_25560 [Kitasatospora griseola]
MRDIALIGRARSGKDTVGARLVSRYGYTRLAFADPLKAMLLDINPVVPYDLPGFGLQVIRLAALVDHIGWDRAKEEYPEARKLLQRVGQSIRTRDPDYWVRVLVDSMDGISGPIVVTDVRYLNEAAALERRGFRLVRITRPFGGETVDAEELAVRRHISEVELADFPTPLTITNTGTLADLRAQADTLPH